MAIEVLDPDILSADDKTLSRIRTQLYRDEVTNKNATAQKLAADTAANYAGLDVVDSINRRQEVLIALIEKYMTTGTATTDAAILADAQADTKRMKAAYDEILRVFAL